MRGTKSIIGPKTHWWRSRLLARSQAGHRDKGGGVALLPAPKQAEVAPSVTCHNNDFFDVRITLGYYEHVATDRNLERGVAMPGTSLGEFLPASERDLKG